MPSLSSAKLLILWKDTLCWSSLDNHQDAKVIYDYLTNESSGLIDDGILNQVKEKGIPIITFRACPKWNQPNLRLHGSPMRQQNRQRMRQKNTIIYNLSNIFFEDLRNIYPFQDIWLFPTSITIQPQYRMLK